MPDVAAAQPSILVVEDEAIVALDLESSLSSLGYRIAGVASSRREALEIAEKTAPDLVVMDIKLDGEFDGIAAAHEIRSRWHVPVVFLTAYVSDETLARARAVGAHGYLVKPFRGSELNAAIIMALNQHRLASELFAEHAWLRTLLGSLSDAVIATDAAGNIRYLNGAAESLLGWPQAEALGRPIDEVYRVMSLHGVSVTTSQLSKVLHKPVATGKQRFRLCTRSGRRVPIEDSASPIVKDGRVIGAVTVFLDVSARVAAEQRQERQRHRLKTKVESTVAALGQTRAELQALSRHLMTAQEEERCRVARELHDDLGQQTALLEIEADRLRQLLSQSTGGDAVQGTLSSVVTRSREIAEGLRGVSHRLHPSALEDLGLQVALRLLVDEHRRCGEDISLVEQGELPPLPLLTKTALYRIVQESLRNARRHAPQAPVRIELRMASASNELRLHIEDAGPGFEVRHVRASGGLGLLSMQERARSLGGSLEIDSAPDQGTRIHVTVPLDAAD